MEDNQSESYDEAKLDSLRQEIRIGKAQLLELAYSERTSRPKQRP
jgi:hypothetical protein